MTIPEYPFFRAAGPTHEAAAALGDHWGESLRYLADRREPTSRPWWKQRQYARVIDEVAPHLPDVYIGMAKGAGVPEDAIGTQIVGQASDGCTSFVVPASRTRDGFALAGQNKDGPLARRARFQVIAFEPTDSPSFLTLTYPGQLYGQGFVAGGCAVYRNQLYAGQRSGLPYLEWGVLALHCKTVSQVEDFTARLGVTESVHVVVLDEQGHALGIESSANGLDFFPCDDEIYTHANAVCGNPLSKLPVMDPGDEIYTRADSLSRQQRLYDLLGKRNDWTCQTLFQPLADHEGSPRSICRHQEPEVALTVAAVVSDARRGELWIAAGSPCEAPPRCYRLAEKTSSQKP